MSLMTGRWPMVVAVAAVILLFASSGIGRAADSVTLRLEWVVGSEHAPIYLALEKGFFKDQGIDVKIFAGEGSPLAVKLVGNRSNDFGNAAAEQVLMAYAKGLPVVATAVFLQKSPGAIIFPKGKPIRKLEDLYGKRLGTQVKAAVHMQWESVTKLHKIDRTKIIEIPFDRAIASAITAEKIDAGVVFFHNDGLLLEARGTPVGALMFSDLGLQIYSTSLIAHEDMLKEKPDLVRRFTRAFVNGWTYSREHPEEALAAFLKANPAVDPVYSKLKLPAVLALTETDETKRHGIGYSTKAGWEAVQRVLIDMKMMEKPIDVTKAFTNEYLK